MTDINKESISVLNDLIETSKDGQEGFKTCAEDIKHPQLKALFVQRAADCATAAAELQAAVRSLGGDPETSTSVAGDLHRRWRSEEHTSELQSLMRISYAVFCLKKKNKINQYKL